MHGRRGGADQPAPRSRSPGVDTAANTLEWRRRLLDVLGDQHSTTASSHNHNCSRSCEVRQLAGSHDRGSNRASPSADLLRATGRGTIKFRYANGTNGPGAGKGCTNSR
jgi:hypothetical protein